MNDAGVFADAVGSIGSFLGFGPSTVSNNRSRSSEAAGGGSIGGVAAQPQGTMEALPS